jgi:hypothetical protein
MITVAGTMTMARASWLRERVRAAVAQIEADGHQVSDQEGQRADGQAGRAQQHVAQRAERHHRDQQPAVQASAWSAA